MRDGEGDAAGEEVGSVGKAVDEVRMAGCEEEVVWPGGGWVRQAEKKKRGDAGGCGCQQSAENDDK